LQHVLKINSYDNCTCTKYQVNTNGFAGKATRHQITHHHRANRWKRTGTLEHFVGKVNDTPGNCPAVVCSRKHDLFLLRFVILLCFASRFCGAQPVVYTASVSEEDRITLVRSTVQLTTWHEASFWTQYKTYLDKLNAVSSRVYGTSRELAQMDEATDKEDAFETGNKLIAYCREELALRREYFVEIGREHNGVIGLQFLQTETLLDMVESSQVYRDEPWKSIPLPSLASQSSKHEIIAKTLRLSPEEASLFLPVYKRYEQESDQVLGEEYTVYDLFSTEPSDFTPALAKRQGYDFLTVMSREITIKEKYFNEMNRVGGPLLAARFLAWEDYFATTCKMKLWSRK
jgi:hypothetical protein